MTKPLLIIIVSIFVSATSLAQSVKNNSNRDSVAFYMADDHAMAHNQADAQFLRLIIKAKGGMYEVQDYYPNGTLRLLAHTYLQEMLFEERTHGQYVEYYPNGSRHFVRNYNMGMLSGDDSTFYDNGKLFNVVNHTGSGDFMRTYIDSAGKTIAENGNGYWIKVSESDAKETLSGTIVNGKEEGVWVQRYAGDPAGYKLEYKDGMILTATDTRPQIKIFTAVDKQPTFGADENSFNKYIGRAIRYPKEARDSRITGRVILTFVVEKDGTLTDIKVLRAPDKSLGDEAVRVLKASPKWHPGIQNGKPVRVQFSVPVSFQL